MARVPASGPQKDKNWRWDDANDATSYMIYNDQQKKTWVVNGDTAIESSGADNPSINFNPATMLSAFAYLPSTNRSGDTWEFNMPGIGKVDHGVQGPGGSSQHDDRGRCLGQKKPSPSLNTPTWAMFRPACSKCPAM